MAAVKAVWHNGQVILERQPDWPEGRTLLVSDIPDTEHVRMRDDDRLSPEEIARTLAAMENMQPLVFTPEEEAAWQAERRAQKEWEKAHFEEHVEKLRRMWE
jgi:hypothetical protein